MTVEEAREVLLSVMDKNVRVLIINIHSGNFDMRPLVQAAEVGTALRSPLPRPPDLSELLLSLCSNWDCFGRTVGSPSLERQLQRK